MTNIIPISNKDFVHFHCHTCHSKQDALPRPKEYANALREMGFLAGAVTDHGEMSGLIDFVTACRAPGEKAPIKPILGIEAYVVPDRHFKQKIILPNGEKAFQKHWHLTLIAENMKGYQNLLKLYTIGSLEGLYRGNPRIDRPLIEEYNEGIIAFTGCMGSEINQAILRGDLEEAEKVMRWYKNVFGEDRYFAEFQYHGIPAQVDILKALKTLAKKVGLKSIITNDVHYVRPEDYVIHDIQITMRDAEKDESESNNESANEEEENISKKRTKKDAYATHQFYLKTAAEMYELLGKHLPDSMANTCEIAERITDFLPLDVAHTLPDAHIPEIRTDFDKFKNENLPYHNEIDAYLYYLAYEGLKKRGMHNNKEYLDRLKFELFTIACMGVSSYFLILKDIVDYMRNDDISFGVRGSSVGSLVNWCLYISAEDPIRFELLFERFLNPGRGNQYGINYSVYPLKTWMVERKGKPDVISEADAHKYIKQIVNTKRKEAEYVQHGFRMSMELWVLENQGLCSYICDLAQNYVSEENDSQLWIAYLIGAAKEKPTNGLKITKAATLPDIDIDVQDDKRDNVLDYIVQKHGQEYVANICTVGTYKAKAAVTNVLKSSLKFQQDWEKPNDPRHPTKAYEVAQTISKLIPTPPQDIASNIEKLSQHFAESLKTIPELAKWVARYPEEFEHAKRIVGIMSHRGIHAAGLVLSKYPISDRAPVTLLKKKNQHTGVERMVACTTYDMASVERIGLVKYDILGLKLYQKIHRTVKLIEKRHNKKIDIDLLELNDKHVFNMFASGITETLFQFSSPGMQESLKLVKVDTFEDLVAIVALYRPGPKAYIPNYAMRKQGREHYEFKHPILEKVMGKTYNIMVYQEQAMKMASLMADFTAQEVDKFRKAISKKQGVEFEQLCKLFSERSMKNGVDKSIVDEILALMETFGGYAFNRAHAVGYAKLAYVTGYFKYYYPHEWLTACMQVDGTGTDGPAKILGLKAVAERSKIKVINPNVNESGLEIVLTKDNKIALPLTSLKGVGNKMVLPILDKQPYTDFRHFVLEGRPNAGLVKNLALGGALSCFPELKGQSFEYIITIHDAYVEERKQLDKEAVRTAKLGCKLIPIHQNSNNNQGFVNENFLLEASQREKKTSNKRQVKGVMNLDMDLFN